MQSSGCGRPLQLYGRTVLVQVLDGFLCNGIFKRALKQLSSVRGRLCIPGELACRTPPSFLRLLWLVCDSRHKEHCGERLRAKTECACRGRRSKVSTALNCDTRNSRPRLCVTQTAPHEDRCGSPSTASKRHESPHFSDLFPSPAGDGNLRKLRHGGPRLVGTSFSNGRSG